MPDRVRLQVKSGQGDEGWEDVVKQPATEETLERLIARNPIIYNVAMPNMNTEYSQVLPDNTKKVLIKLRDIDFDLKIAWAEGESGTNYLTIPAGASKLLEGVNLVGKTIYFQSSGENQVCEIEVLI